MLKFKYFLFFLICIGFYQVSKATHNRAGEITYKWLSGYTYEIKIITYTNIGGPNLADRCADTIAFGDGTGALVLRSNGTTNTLCPASGAKDGVALSLTIKLNEYVTIHTYPGPGNYKMSVEDPNRNAGTINIPNSVNQLFYIESYLVIPGLGAGNNSPVLTFPPLDNGCVTQCFYHNPGAYDIDGDSISYQLVMCKSAGGITCPGYTYPASGGGVFKLDSLNGTLTWCTPQLQGLYSVAMLIKEWRLDANGNYFLIGYVERDMQVEVGNCNNVPPIIIFNNLDTCILVNSIITNTITANDVNADVITLAANGGPFAFSSNPSSFASMPSTSVTSGLFNWSTNYTHVRRLPYQVTIKVTDDDPNISLVHFKTFNVKVIPDAPINLFMVTSNNTILLKWNKPNSYSLSGSNIFSNYKVYRKNGVSTWNHTSQETVPPAYTGFVYIGSTINGVNDTLFYDYNNGNAFTSGQDYSYVVIASYTDGATSYVSNISSQQFFVGIEELPLTNSDIHISPNPTENTLTVSFNQNSNELFTFELVDITGRQIKMLLTDESLNKQNNIQLNIENITKGVYFLKIKGNKNTSITKKIIKQ